MIKKLILLIAVAWVLLFAVVGALELAFNRSGSPDPTPATGTDVSLTRKPKVPLVFPAFEMVDQSGDTLNNASLRGRVWLASFVYAQCNSICPVLNRVMGEVASRTETESVGFLSFSSDPTDDSQRLQRYQKQYPVLAAATWHVIRADTLYLPTLAAELNIIRSPDVLADGYFAVSENLYLIDKSGTVVGVYNGFDAKQVEALKVNAGRLVRDEPPLPSPTGEPIKTPLPQLLDNEGKNS